MRKSSATIIPRSDEYGIYCDMYFSFFNWEEVGVIKQPLDFERYNTLSSGVGVY